MANLANELSVPYPTAGETYAASIVPPGLSMVLVLLRIYTRLIQKHPLGIDDWLMLPALVGRFQSTEAWDGTDTKFDIGYGSWDGDNPHYRLVVVRVSRSPH